MKPRVREDKAEPAKCPFCSEYLKAPERIKTATGESLGGRCRCGAVYCLDPTGHNVGEAYLDALTLAYGEELDLASEDSYEEVVLNYDARAHKLSPVKEIRRLDSSGKMVFVRVRDTIDK
ncbi:MAG TPA: hypothetical protein VFG09_00460 [Thermodesulfovibrionales bacterium]|jgi:hypothetical protein|nr:hypothetical protein [Thermodesulfovibrionales bacterium]